MRNLSLSTLLGTLCLASCGVAEQESQEASSVKYVVVNDTIPDTRSSVVTEPVASYKEDIKTDPLNQWEFAVQVYETSETFTYLAKIRYKELDTQDTIYVPKFGVSPRVVVKKGEKDLHCLVGFLDKNEEFKPHKLVYIEDNTLRIKVVKQYRTGIFQKQK